MSTVLSTPALARVSLLAPVTGVPGPIEQVPGPVFAQKGWRGNITKVEAAAEMRGQLTAELEPR